MEEKTEKGGKREDENDAGGEMSREKKNGRKIRCVKAIKQTS